MNENRNERIEENLPNNKIMLIIVIISTAPKITLKVSHFIYLFSLFILFYGSYTETPAFDVNSYKAILVAWCDPKIKK